MRLSRNGSSRRVCHHLCHCCASCLQPHQKTMKSHVYRLHRALCSARHMAATPSAPSRPGCSSSRTSAPTTLRPGLPIPTPRSTIVRSSVGSRTCRAPPSSSAASRGVRTSLSMGAIAGGLVAASASSRACSASMLPLLLPPGSTKIVHLRQRIPPQEARATTGGMMLMVRAPPRTSALPCHSLR